MTPADVHQHHMDSLIQYLVAFWAVLGCDELMKKGASAVLNKLMWCSQQTPLDKWPHNMFLVHH